MKADNIEDDRGFNHSRRVSEKSLWRGTKTKQL